MKITPSDFFIKGLLPIVNLVVYLVYRSTINVTPDFDYFYGSFTLFLIIGCFGTLINSYTTEKYYKKLLIVIISYSVVNIVFLVTINTLTTIFETTLYSTPLIFYCVLIILSFYRMSKNN